ncbi:glycoside hydrolase family 19 protein [Myxococcaceae bacterium GXIMD 01537]
MSLGTPPPPTGQAATAPGWVPAPTVDAVLFQGQFLRKGQQGPAVADIQRLLGIQADGFFGAGTSAAVQSFQQSVRMSPYSETAGTVGKTTLRTLLSVKQQWLPAPSLAEVRAGLRLVWQGEAGLAVKVLQRLLALPTNVRDGHFGSATQGAVLLFQRASGLRAPQGLEGVVDRTLMEALLQRLGPRLGSVTAQQLRAIMPKLPEAQLTRDLPYLNCAMIEADIVTPLRQAAFLAQLAHESGELRFMEELSSGAAYEGRRDLGNTQPGDGPRYKGRGPIQLTGRANYRAAGLALGVDLEGNPTRAKDPDVSYRVAGWYWDSRNLNPLADFQDFVGITRAINGGLNGLDQRQRYYAVAKQALGA